jgi:hypothetical protein
LFALRRQVSHPAAMKTVLEEKEEFIVDASSERACVVLDLPTCDMSCLRQWEKAWGKHWLAQRQNASTSTCADTMRSSIVSG